MQIELTGTNVEITEGLRELVQRRLDKVGRQVSELAVCEVILAEERNPSIRDSQKAEAILVLKGATLNAKAAAPEMQVALGEVAGDLQRQVEKLRDKRIGKRREGAPSIRHLEADTEVPESTRIQRIVPRGGRGAAAPAAILRPMGLLDRALNIGEAKQFRQYEKRVAAIGAFEDELIPASDEELRAGWTGCASASGSRESTSTTCCPSASRSSARPAAARWRCAISTSSWSAGWSSTAATSPR